MLNLPNIITLSRLAISPLIVVSISKNWKLLTLLFILTAGISDLLDGFIARRLKQVTSLGIILDPIADKILIACIVIPALLKKVIPMWVGVIFIGKEIIISSTVLVLYVLGKAPRIKPTFAGKTAIFLEGAYIILVLLLDILQQSPLLSSAVSFFTLLSVFACIIAPFTYIPQLVETIRS